MSGVFLAAPVYCTDKALPQALTSALASALPKVSLFAVAVDHYCFRLSSLWNHLKFKSFQYVKII